MQRFNCVSSYKIDGVAPDSGAAAARPVSVLYQQQQAVALRIK